MYWKRSFLIECPSLTFSYESDVNHMRTQGRERSFIARCCGERHPWLEWAPRVEQSSRQRLEPDPVVLVTVSVPYCPCAVDFFVFGAVEPVVWQFGWSSNCNSLRFARTTQKVGIYWCIAWPILLHLTVILEAVEDERSHLSRCSSICISSLENPGSRTTTLTRMNHNPAIPCHTPWDGQRAQENVLLMAITLDNGTRIERPTAEDCFCGDAMG